MQAEVWFRYLVLNSTLSAINSAHILGAEHFVEGSILLVRAYGNQVLLQRGLMHTAWVPAQGSANSFWKDEVVKVFLVMPFNSTFI